MRLASDYLAFVKSALIACPYVADITIVRDEAFAETGLYRYRVTLTNGGLLEICERFTMQDGEVKVTKYRFHWQDTNGLLQKRWDNAAHHPSLETFPHHVHIGSEGKVMPHHAVVLTDVLRIVSEALSGTQEYHGNTENQLLK